ncbi:MAG: hypothetical protein CMO55_14980 [Verrucomicrobiales bacterium]|nr:hypothetical protein [Verrucomicrobiales bacterium]
MSEEIWFYEFEGERKGPVTESRLQSLIEDGTIQASSLVWKEGFDDWMPAEDVDSLVFSRRPLPPSLPAVVSQPPAVRAAFVPREARMRAGFVPEIGECFSAALKQMKSDFWPYVGLFALTSLIVSFASQLYVPIFFMMYPIMVGFSWYVLCRKRGVSASTDAIFEGFRRQFGPLAILNLILVGVVIVATLLFTGLAVGATIGGGVLIGEMNPSGPESPLIAVSLGLAAVVGALVLMFLFALVTAVGNFAMLLILDCEISAGQAIRLSWEVTRMHWFKIALFSIVANLLTIAGALVLYVGVFVTGALSTMAMVHLYIRAFGDEADQGEMT